MPCASSLRFLSVLSLSFLFLLSTGSSPSLQAAGAEGVVLVISDGTSNELLTAARVYRHGVEGTLALEGLPRSAFVRTYSLTHVVTDSGAAATAMARGVKATNRTVGLGERPAESILDLAQKAGWSTAVVTDDSVTGSTPAPFLIEHPDRDENHLIAGKILAQLGTRVDILLGGGRRWFADLGASAYKKEVEHIAARDTEHRLRERDDVAVFAAWPEFQKFVATETAAAAKAAAMPAPAPAVAESTSISTSTGGRGAKPPAVLGIFEPNYFPFYLDAPGRVRVKDMTELTLSLLRARGKPFLLVVETALADKAAHLNHAKRALTEVLELDETVRFLRENLGAETLLLVTTDHFTGGFALNGYPLRRVRGELLLGRDPLTESPFLTWATGPGGPLKGPRALPAPAAGDLALSTGTSAAAALAEKSEADPTASTFRHPAALYQARAVHTGADVWLLAQGPGSERVHGFLDNTDIYRIMRDAIAPAGGNEDAGSARQDKSRE